MKNIARGLCFTALALLLMVGTGYAKFWDFSSNHSPHDRATVQIVQATKLTSGAELQPGTYDVRVVQQGNQATIEFYRLNKLVAQTPAKLVNTSKKIQQTEVDYNTASGHTAEMTGMEFSGWHRKIVMTSSQGSHAGS